MPTGTANSATGIDAHNATLQGSLNGLGGYASAEMWFDYGTTTSYGSSTPHQNLSAVGSLQVSISGLTSGTLYHFRLSGSNAQGTLHSTERNFTTQNNGPGAPSATASSSVTSRDESFWVVGSATDPDGDPLNYSIDWADGNVTFAPAGSMAPSGTPYNVSHAYERFGHYTIIVRSLDQSGTPISSAPANVVHDVVDYAGIGESSPTLVYRVTATLNGNLSSIGGDPAGAQLRFEWGPVGSGYTNSSTTRTFFGPSFVQANITGLTPGVTYHSRIVAISQRGVVNTTPDVNFTTNVRATLSTVDAFQPTQVDGMTTSFVARYADAQNESPAAGFPRVTVDGSASYPMTRLGNSTNYTRGVSYIANVTLPRGLHSYQYETKDAVPEVIAIPGSYAAIRVNRSTDRWDTIQAGDASGLPGPSWARTDQNDGIGGSEAPPYWHTVRTPALPALYDTPERMATPNSDPISLWFGSDQTGTYANGDRAAGGTVTTPSIDLGEGATHAVRFWTYFDTQDDPQHDTKRISVIDETLGDRETFIMELHGPTQGANHWWPVAFSVNNWTGHSIRLKFEFTTRDGLDNERAGWFIDNLIVGHDTDNDGIPDSAERQDVFGMLWLSPDLNFTRDGLPSAREYGIQHAFTSAAFVFSILETTNMAATSLRFNGSWPPLNLITNGNTSPGTGRATIPGGSSYLTVTDLKAAGMSLGKLYAQDNYTMTVTGPGAKLDTFGLLALGQSSPLVADSDSDSVSDGVELTRIGTHPLSSDADGDAFPDGIDSRPFTPDLGPELEFGAYNDNWHNGAWFRVATQYGDASVTAWRLDGNTWSQLNVEHDWDNQYHVVFNSDPAQLKVEATDGYGTKAIANLTFTLHSQLDVTGAGATLVRNDAVIWGSAATSVGEGLAPGVYAKGFRTIMSVGMRAVVPLAVLTFVLELTPTAGGGDPPDPLDVVRADAYATPVVWPSNGNPFGSGDTGKWDCGSTALGYFMLEGQGDEMARRGARGMMREYPSEYTTKYIPGARVQDALQSADHWTITTGSSTARLLYLDGNSVLHSWSLSKAPGKCSVEVLSEIRQAWGNVGHMSRAEVRAWLAGGAAAFVAAAVRLDKNWRDPPSPELPKLQIQIVDANTSTLADRVYAYDVPGDEFAGELFARARHGMASTSDEQLVGEWAWQWIHGGAVGTTCLGGSMQPAWYWNATRASVPSSPPCPSNGPTFVSHGQTVDDVRSVSTRADGRPLYFDQMAYSPPPENNVVEMGSIGAKWSGSAMIEYALYQSAQNLCSYRQTDPSYRDAFITTSVAIGGDYGTYVVLKLASSLDQLPNGGCS